MIFRLQAANAKAYKGNAGQTGLLVKYPLYGVWMLSVKTVLYPNRR